MCVPVKLSMEEEKRQKAHTYHCLLTTEDGQMPDPNDLENWIKEEEGRARWPKVYEDDIDRYFSRYTEPSPHRKRPLTAYKVIYYYTIKFNALKTINVCYRRGKPTVTRLANGLVKFSITMHPLVIVF